MMVINDNFNIKLKDKTFIALGSFDGLHLGHLALINKVLELAKENNAKSMVNTFINHPLSIIDKSRIPKLIMSNETKANILTSLGIDIINFANFDSDFMKISPEDYILNLINHYNAIGFVVGFNHKFGHKNQGDINLLKRLSLEYNFKLYIVSPIKCDEEIISSTGIREKILSGNIEEANKMLLKPFMLEGKIIEGKKVGRTIGFPTANLEYHKDFALPKMGVYYTVVKYNNNLYKGITSIGKNPTIIGINKLTIETYILDFKSNIYNKNIELYFINRIRDMVKFNNLDDLKAQMERDKTFAKEQNIEI
ncbi:bifunctional riboflavin kinase/FAD synthetase [Clostridium akagii]|uniref:bifunctional riboflavin kinase/FAD synthetase n=1 Tax=Clostridium akagii TaxID=91623 RepID=UPI00047ECCC3|nr:bifunctional riboflavin kinase/FAD synthetase [Clostridium akagii]